MREYVILSPASDKAGISLFQWENGTETATLKIQSVWNTCLITDVLENDKPVGLN